MRFKLWMVMVTIFSFVFFNFFSLPNYIQGEEIENPLKIEKVIGLSTKPGTFRMSRPGDYSKSLPPQQGLAISKDGLIYIGDNAEGQIEIFNTKLESIGNFGSLGSENGQFQSLVAMVFDQEDNLYTVDYFLKVVQVFTKNGKFLRRFGEFEDKKNQLPAPIDVFFLNSKELVVVDQQLGLKVFSKDGLFIRDFTQYDKILSPDYRKINATVDFIGNVYVMVEPTNYMSSDLYLFKFLPDGTFIGNVLDLGYDIGDRLFKYASNYKITTDGNYLYISDHYIIQKYEIQKEPEKPIKLVTTFLKIIEKKLSEEFHDLGKSDFCYPSAILSQNNKFYVLDGYMNRLLIFSQNKEFLGSIQSSIKELCSLYESDADIPKGFFSQPIGIKIDQMGNWIVANYDFGRVSIMNPEGQEIQTMGSKPDNSKEKIEPGDLFKPARIVIDQQGNIFVKDGFFIQLIQVFGPDYKPFFVMPILNDNLFAFAVNSMGHLVVSEGDPNFIKFYDISKIREKKIKLIKKFSIDKNYAIDIAIDSEDIMVIRPFYGDSLLWIDTSGNIVRKVGNKDEENPVFQSSYSICVDGNNDVYIVEYTGVIHKYSSQGKFLWKNDLNWFGITELAIDGKGKLLLTDRLHNVILEVSDKTVTPVKHLKPDPIPTEAVFSLEAKNKDSIIEEDTITIAMSGKNIKMLATMSASLIYPTDILTFKSVKISDEMKESGFRIYNVENKENRISFTTTSVNKKEYYESGDMILFEFIAKKAGKVTISIDNLELKNSLDRIVLYQEKIDLNFAIEMKDRIAPNLKIQKLPLVVYSPTITIYGETEPDTMVSINSTKVLVDGDGTFKAELQLQKGKNEIIVIAKDKANNQTEYRGLVTLEDPIQIKLRIGSKIIWIQGNAKLLDAEPFIDKASGRTMVPLLAIVQGIHAKVEYESSTRKITIQFEDIEIILWIGKQTALVNGNDIKIDDIFSIAPVIVNGRTFLPLRFIADNLHFRTEWDNSTQTITLTYPGDLFG